MGRAAVAADCFLDKSFLQGQAAGLPALFRQHRLPRLLPSGVVALTAPHSVSSHDIMRGRITAAGPLPVSTGFPFRRRCHIPAPDRFAHAWHAG